MATITDETQKKNAADFEAAYGEEVKKPEQSEDEAFGLVPGEAPGTATPTGAPAVAVDLDKGADGAQSEQGEQGGAAAAAPAGEEGAAAAAPAVDVEKETQRLKSWEGRLKAQQAEIDRAKAEAAAAAERGTDTAAAAPDDKGGKDGDDEAYKAAMEALEADFGPEFVQLLITVVKGMATRTATEHAAPYRQDIDAIIAEITSDKQRAHFEKIADAHPDFLEISESDAFKAWVAGLEEADKAETERITTSGSAKEIIAMLTRYKATLESKDTGAAELDAAMDQAEGVRSTGGLKLPESPKDANDFASAWKEF